MYSASKVDVAKHGLMKFREERSILGLGGFHERYFILNTNTLRMYKEVRVNTKTHNTQTHLLFSIYVPALPFIEPPVVLLHLTAILVNQQNGGSECRTLHSAPPHCWCSAPRWNQDGGCIIRLTFLSWPFCRVTGPSVIGRWRAWGSTWALRRKSVLRLGKGSPVFRLPHRAHTPPPALLRTRRIQNHPSCVRNAMNTCVTGEHVWNQLIPFSARLWHV